ncbi:ClpP-like prohead protease/major capsid protein fusion protein [Stutzerimonas balearica]|uniref:ClpP-like prohead protease/major capsid protein fusion protein n=1 Tax=Stutzerimonas balearica TaxID=74829 RepID=UPI0028A9716F|nr:ClpP-like prohead protease/major capsid protein fusion protein [Stutzerimonas balearica]
MGSHMKMTTLLAPMAMAVAAALSNETAPEQSWYSIQAKGKGRAEILLYDEIGGWGVSARRFASDLKALGDLDQIDLHIHSPGGDVFEGTAIYNLLKNHPAKVVVYIDGLAASMASVIAMAGDTVYMPENAMMMVHKPWGIQGGDADDMRRYAELLDKVESTLVMAYVSKTGKGEDEIQALLKDETWMTGREAVEAGFADQLTEPLAAAAQLTSKRMQEFAHMPEALNALMQPRAQTTVTPPAAPTPAPAAPQPVPVATTTTPQPAPAPVADPNAIRAQLMAEENQRRQGISALFQPFAAAQGDLLQQCLGDMNVTVEQAQAKLLAKLGEGATPTPSAHIYAGNGNVVGDSVRNSVEARIGLVKAEKENKFVGMPLAELARASLVHRGVGIAGMDRMGIVGLAFTHTTSDFGHILGDIANKSMLKGYQEAEETFQKWTSKGTLTDFKPTKRVDLTSFPNLGLVAEGAEYTYATMGDRAESIVLATYGKLFSITRQVVINDDLSALDRIPRSMGRAAIRTVGDLVYAVLGNNPKMSDGKALFHADHGNLLTPGEALSVGRIDAALSAMQTQQEGDAILNIMAKYMLVPVALRSTANALIGAEYDPALADAKVPNPVRGLVDVIADARLDKQSKLHTYFAADPAVHDTIEVAYLDGNEQPYMEQQQGFTVDGAVFKVRMDAGVAPMSWRTINKVLGA